MSIVEMVLERGDVPEDVKQEIQKCFTKFMKVQAALEESERKHRLLFESAGDAIYIHDTGGRVLSVNKTACHMLGYSREELQSMYVHELDAPNEVANGPLRMAQVLAQGWIKFETLHKRKDGSYIPVDVNAQLVAWNGVPAVMSICRDITERKQAEDALRESEAKFRTIFDNKGSATCLFGDDSVIRDCNTMFETLSGHTKADIIDKMRWTDFVFSDDLPKMVGYHEARTGKGNNAPVQYEFRFKNRSGEVRHAMVNIALVNETRIVSIMDVTEQRRAEEEMSKNLKLESLGVLAGGIAHDFNNLLVGILGNLSLLDACGGNVLTQQLRKHVEGAIKATTQATYLAQRLLAFSKGGIQEIRVASAAKVVREACELSIGAGHQVTCEFEYKPDLCSALIDEGQIFQVFHNLAINARQAMPEGGVIQVVAENVQLLPGELAELPLGGVYVCVRVQDNGIGMPESILPRIFDPYFTTKNTGSGLGLALTHRVVKDHGGAITVESEQGKGTTFRVYLPASVDCLVPVQEKKEVKKVPALRILVMDDDALVREVLGGMLTHLGHSVTFTENGEDAVKEYKKTFAENDQYDVVILDLTIPKGMGGKETFDCLKTINPTVVSIASSGYSDSLPTGFTAVLGKPYTLEELAETLASVMKNV
jgi:PAS domain S-box-containing protein